MRTWIIQCTNSPGKELHHRHSPTSSCIHIRERTVLRARRLTGPGRRGAPSRRTTNLNFEVVTIEGGQAANPVGSGVKGLFDLAGVLNRVKLCRISRSGDNNSHRQFVIPRLYKMVRQKTSS